MANGFYKGCRGPVIKAVAWTYEQINYYIDATCSSVDGKYTHKAVMEFSQQDLIPDVSEN